MEKFTCFCTKEHALFWHKVVEVLVDLYLWECKRCIRNQVIENYEKKEH